MPDERAGSRQSGVDGIVQTENDHFVAEGRRQLPGRGDYRRLERVGSGHPAIIALQAAPERNLSLRTDNLEPRTARSRRLECRSTVGAAGLNRDGKQISF